MTFVIPTAVHLMQTDWDLDARARGAFAGTLEAQPATRNIKSQGSLPLTGSQATAFVNTQASSATGPLRGIYWEFLATGGYDVSVDTKVMIFTSQFNAPNRIQCATKANDGFVVRLGTGVGSPPANYRTWQVGGNDVLLGKAREFPRMFVIDMNVSDHDALVGTYDNTDVEVLGVGTVRFNISGTSTLQHFLQRVFVFDTAKAATNIPRFTGLLSDWDDVITALGTSYNTKISHEWLLREGTVFSIACPVEIGDNATATTFNDGGAFVFWPNSNDALDPRVHVTDQAFRVYLNLRSNAADTAAFSGFYDAGDSYPPWDFDQDDLAVVTLSGVRFNRTGTFLVGSSVSGPATWNDCGLVDMIDVGIDLDGSTFRSPHSTHLLRLPGAQTIANMRFETYAANHAIEIDVAGTYTLSNVFFDQSGTNDVENTSGGLVTINVVAGGTVPTVTNTGGGSTSAVNTVVTITVKDVVANSRVRVERDDTGAAVLQAEAVSATSIWREQFEGTGYENTWSEGESVGGSSVLDEDFATSSVTGSPTDWGSDCLRVNRVGASDVVTVAHNFGQAQNVVYVSVEVILIGESFGANDSVTFLSIQELTTRNACCFFRFKESGANVELECIVNKNDLGNTAVGSAVVLPDVPYQVEGYYDIDADSWGFKIREVSDFSREDALPFLIDIAGSDLGVNARIPRFIELGATQFVGAAEYVLARLDINTAIFPEDASDLVDVTGSFNFSTNLVSSTKVRKQSRSPRYLPVNRPGTITVNGLTVVAGQAVDGVAQ